MTRAIAHTGDLDVWDSVGWDMFSFRVVSCCVDLFYVTLDTLEWAVRDDKGW